jgi:hypothetical protein
MSTTMDPQTRMDETVIDHSTLEAALDEREKRLNSKRELTKQYKEANDKVRALLGEFNLQDGEVARCGRWRISKKAIPARSVAFEAAPSSRIQIQLAVLDDV